MIKVRILYLGYSGFMIKFSHSELSFVIVYSKLGLLRAKLESLRVKI